VALSRANRLRRRQDFKDVYQSGRRRTGTSLTVRCLRLGLRPSPQQRSCRDDVACQVQSIVAPQNKPATRIGISISQKVSKKAVVRNRIKRQIRAALRQLLPRMAPGWLVVIVVRPSACECDYVEILRELEQLLVEAEVINGHSRGSLL